MYRETFQTWKRLYYFDAALQTGKLVASIMRLHILGAEQDSPKDLPTSCRLAMWVRGDLNSGNWCVCSLVDSG